MLVATGGITDLESQYFLITNTDRLEELNFTCLDKNFVGIAEEIRSDDGKSVRYIFSLIDMALEPISILSQLNSEQVRKFYAIYVNSMWKLTMKYDGKIVKTYGDSIKSYFPRTSNKNNLSAIKQALDCSLKQMDSRSSMEEKLNREGLPGIDFRITVDYEMLRVKWDNDNWNIILPIPLIDRMCEQTPSNVVSVGEDLFNEITLWAEIKKEYEFDLLGSYPVGSVNSNLYSLYSLSRKDS